MLKCHTHSIRTFARGKGPFVPLPGADQPGIGTYQTVQVVVLKGFLCEVRVGDVFSFIDNNQVRLAIKQSGIKRQSP